MGKGKGSFGDTVNTITGNQNRQAVDAAYSRLQGGAVEAAGLPGYLCVCGSGAVSGMGHSAWEPAHSASIQHLATR